MQNKQMMQKNKPAVEGKKPEYMGSIFQGIFILLCELFQQFHWNQYQQKGWSAALFFPSNSWGILNFKLLETLTATLLPVIASLFNLVLSKLCHQPRYDHTDCHPSVYCINCSSIHKIQHRWKFTHPNEVLFSFYALNGYWLPWLQPELPWSLINYLPAEHLASRG